MNAFNEDLKFAGQAIWQVLLASVILGAGLPAIFALGIRSLAWGTGGSSTDGGTGRGNLLGRIVAVVLFVVVAYAIVSGLLFIIASGQGKEISFSHVVPWIVEKDS